MGDRRQLTIEITFDENGVTNARMWKKEPGRTPYAIKVGSAMCHPDDKFDPEVGSMIALARLFGNDLEFHTIEEKPKEKPERKLTDAEKKALDRGYTLVRDRLPSCTAYDGQYLVMDKNGGSGGGLYWDHKGETFTICKPDNMTNYDRNCARKIWMESPDAVIAWKAQPDTVEQKALDKGYTLCRDRYPDKSGVYDVMTENGAVWHDLYWNGDHFGTCASLWMTNGENPAIAWKGHE